LTGEKRPPGGERGPGAGRVLTADHLGYGMGLGIQGFPIFFFTVFAEDYWLNRLFLRISAIKAIEHLLTTMAS